MKATETLNASIGRILDENLQLDMPRPIKAKMKVVREIIELIESHDIELIEDKCHKLYNLVKEANTPDIRSFEEVQKELAEQKKESALSAEETIKEILKKRIKQLIVDDIISPFYWDDFTKELLSSHMEGYRQAGIREELINYDKYCGSHNLGPNLLSPESNVDEYLKSKK